MYAKNMSEEEALEWLEETLTNGAKPKSAAPEKAAPAAKRVVPAKAAPVAKKVATAKPKTVATRAATKSSTAKKPASTRK
jgi:hypothetical protein